MDNNGKYSRGSLYVVSFILCFVFILYTFIYVSGRKKSVSKTQYRSLMVFPIPFIVGCFFQQAVVGLNLVWPGMTISLLVIYISIQNSRLSTDHLTGICNRRQLDAYLDDKIYNRSPYTLLAGIMIDVDNFKQINDQYGHAIGDKALRITAGLLKSSLKSNDFIARYAGDEFVIILNVKTKQDLEMTIKRIEKNIDLLNEKNLVPFKLSLSIGYDAIDHREKTSPEQFIKNIDSLMYKVKKAKDRAKTRPTLINDY